MPGRCENCCENINESVRRRRILLCSLFWMLIFVGFAIRVIKYYYSTPNNQPSTSSWDYLLFAQSWPVSFCMSVAGKDTNPAEKCRNIPKNDERPTWTVHGIWPARRQSKPYFENCALIPFNITDLQPIQNELDLYWASGLKSRDSSSLWQHEWQKHGTCGVQSERLNTLLKYFSQGLEWHRQYNIGKTLADCDIYPDDSKLYGNTQVVDCFKKHFDVIPVINCKFDKVLKKQFLYEIRLCFDTNFNLNSCDNYITQRLCQDNFLYVATVRPKV